MHFYITLWAHWLIIQLQSLYNSSLKSLTSLLHSSWLGSYLPHLISSYLEKYFPASSNIFQHTSSYPYKQYSHITNSPTDLNQFSTNTSSLRESPSDANKKFSGALVPYHNGHQETSLAIDGTLYGYEPFKWRAKTKYMRISRSFKPIEVIRKRRVYLRRYNHDIIMAPRDAKRILKYCTNGCMDLTYRFVYPSSVSKVSLAKEYLIHSPFVSHIEFFIDSHSEKAAKDIVFHQLKKLKKVKACFVLLGALNSLKFLNKWKTLESLRIKCGTEWTLRHWEYLKQVLRPNLNALSLNVRLMIESIKGPEYLQCLEKIYKSSIETLNLKLELQSEYIIDYLFIRCLCMSKVKNLHLRCTGNTVMTDHGVLTYEFQGLLNHLIPRSLGTMGSLTKLKLDFSNDFFVYYRMEDYQLVELCDAIQELPQLVFLDLNVSNGCERANHVADSTLIYLEESLQKLAKLQVLKLNISNTYITFGGLERLCKFAMRLNNLHYFKVNASRNSIDKKKLEEALFSVKDQIVIYCDIIV